MLDLLTNCRVLSTVQQEEDYEGWKAARSKGVGGSEVGAICGVNKYATARTVYLRKTMGYDEDFSDAAKERMAWGHILEPVVADEFAKRSGKKVVVSPATLVHKDFPWAIANVDRFIVDEHGAPYGILECKTADARMIKDWEDGDVPISYIYQLNWYLWITGLKYGAIAALIGGNKFVYYELFINEELLENEIFPKVHHFWNYNVRNLIAPDVTGMDADTELLKDTYTEVKKNSEMTLTEEDDNELAALIVALKAQIKDLDLQLQEAINKLTDKMQNTEIAYTTDHVIKWSPRKQTRVDTEKLKELYPNVFEACKKTINFRVFTVK